MSEISGGKGSSEIPPEKKPESPGSPAVQMNESHVSPEVPEPGSGWVNMVTAIINGAGIGLLLGVLLGLAVSPVVSGVIGTLSGLLAVLLGISEKYMSPLKSVRIGAFGFFCVAGILLGMNIRVNKMLLPSRERMMREYRTVGFTKEEALDFIAFREFGLAPSGWTGKDKKALQEDSSGPAGNGKPGIQVRKVTPTEGVKTPASSGARGREPIASSSTRQFVNPEQSAREAGNVLYSSEINAAECYMLNMADSSHPVAEIRDKFERAGGTWKELAQSLGAGVPEKIYVRALLHLRDCLCQTGKKGTYKLDMTGAVRQINSGQSLEQIRKILEDAGGTWKTIVERFDNDIPAEYQKSLYLSMIQIFKT